MSLSGVVINNYQVFASGGLTWSKSFVIKEVHDGNCFITYSRRKATRKAKELNRMMGVL